MGKYHLKKLGRACDDVIAAFPAYFKVCSNIYRVFYNTFLNEGKTGNDNDDPFARSYNWCYGVRDFAEDAIAEITANRNPASYDGVTKAPTMKDFFSVANLMASAFNSGGYSYGYSKRSAIPTQGANCPLKILRYDNADITNSKLKNLLTNYSYGFTGSIRSCGDLSGLTNFIAHNFDIDISDKTYTELANMTYRQMAAYLPTRPHQADMTPVAIRQVVSYAQYELEPILDAKDEEYNEHSCEISEEEGECEHLFQLSDEISEIQDNIVSYIENKVGGLGALHTDYSTGTFSDVRNPYEYVYSTSSNIANITNQFRFIGVDRAGVPLLNYTSKLATYSLTTTWTQLSQEGVGYIGDIYNVMLERKDAFGYLPFDESEANYTNGCPFYLKSNLWAWLNSLMDGRKNNDRLWRELQHKDDVCSAYQPYRGYMCCLPDLVLKHTIPFREDEQQKNTSGVYQSTRTPRVSYVTIGGETFYTKGIYSDEKAGTISLQRVISPRFDGYYAKVFKEGGESALKEARKMTFSTSTRISNTYKTAGGLATRSTAGGAYVAMLDADGNFTRALPNASAKFAVRPIHRLFPFYLTQKKGVPRSITRGVTLEQPATS